MLIKKTSIAKLSALALLTISVSLFSAPEQYRVGEKVMLEKIMESEKARTILGKNTEGFKSTLGAAEKETYEKILKGEVSGEKRAEFLAKHGKALSTSIEKARLVEFNGKKAEGKLIGAGDKELNAVLNAIAIKNIEVKPLIAEMKDMHPEMVASLTQAVDRDLRSGETVLTKPVINAMKEVYEAANVASKGEGINRTDAGPNGGKNKLTAADKKNLDTYMESILEASYKDATGLGKPEERVRDLKRVSEAMKKDGLSSFLAGNAVLAEPKNEAYKNAFIAKAKELGIEVSEKVTVEELTRIRKEIEAKLGTDKFQEFSQKVEIESQKKFAEYLDSISGTEAEVAAGKKRLTDKEAGELAANCLSSPMRDGASKFCKPAIQAAITAVAAGAGFVTGRATAGGEGDESKKDSKINTHKEDTELDLK